MDGHRLLILFALLMLFVAAMMLRASKADSGAAGAERPVNLWWLGEIGLGAGALSGFYGIGGGFLVVPGLILGTGMPTIAAIGSSLAAIGIFGMTRLETPGLIQVYLGNIVQEMLLEADRTRRPVHRRARPRPTTSKHTRSGGADERSQRNHDERRAAPKFLSPRRCNGAWALWACVRGIACTGGNTSG